MSFSEILIISYLAWNVIVFFIYGFDKRRAENHGWRISEKALLADAFLLGAVGALLAMYSFRHKTSHKKFKIGVPLCLIINIAIIFYLVKL